MTHQIARVKWAKKAEAREVYKNLLTNDGQAEVEVKSEIIKTAVVKSEAIFDKFTAVQLEAIKELLTAAHVILWG